MAAKYRNVMLKLSGEALAGAGKTGLNFDVLNDIALQIKEVVELGVKVSIVVGGGNFWRGRSGGQMDRTRADHMGMLATVINALAMADSLEANGVPTRVQTGIEMRQIAEPYIRGKAVRHLEKGRVVIFACGTGNPYFTTDTAAALRAAEMGVEVILLAKNVDGVYDSDPNKNPNAKKYDRISFMEVLNQDLGEMDLTAATLCKDNHIPLLVFGLDQPENIVKAVSGENIGTIVD